MAFGAVGLGCNLISGVIAARALGPEGRGELAAIMAAPGIAAWAFGLGALQTISYHRARDPHHGPEITSTWLLILIPLSLGAVTVLQLALPTLLSAQSEETLHFARIWAPTVAIAMLTQATNGSLLGAHNYRAFNFMMLVPWLAIATGYCAISLLGEFSITNALWVNFFSFLMPVAIGAFTLHRRHQGFGHPRADLARPTMKYGLKVQGANLGHIVNARLDLLILPALIGAASVGLYSVGTNISWIVVSIAGSIAPIVLPAAAASGEAGERVVAGSLMATLIVAASLATLIGLLADPVIRLLYGTSFLGGIAPMRLLLPGCVLLAGAQVLWSGISASGRPLATAVSQVPGLVITLVGLPLFLREYGINAAAIISSLSYAAVFVCALMIYKRVSTLAWRDLIPSRNFAFARTGSGERHEP